MIETKNRGDRVAAAEEDGEMKGGGRQTEGGDTDTLQAALSLRKASSGGLSPATAALMNLITPLDEAATCTCAQARALVHARRSGGALQMQMKRFFELRTAAWSAERPPAEWASILELVSPFCCNVYPSIGVKKKKKKTSSGLEMLQAI